MLVAFDFGISNTDIAVFKDKKTFFYTSVSDLQALKTESIKQLLLLHNIPISKVTCFGVSGGKSSDLEDSIGSIPLMKINEIDAIGFGAKTLYRIEEETTLIVSTGTGTTCVQVQGNNFTHLGGIAVGGGMLEGLGHLLFKNSNGMEINEFSTQGSRAELDLLIGDVVNKIGNLSNDITAVNFGKAKYVPADTMENTSASLCNMVGEVVGTIAYLNALLIGSSKACFIGRTSYLSEVVLGINARLELAGIEGQYNKNREYANVIGVLETLKNYG